MIKKFGQVFKRILIALFILYGYNVLAGPMNLLVPINIYTISLVSILGIPSLFMLALMLIFVF